MYDISLIGTQGKQPAAKTRQDSLFTSKRSEAAKRSETCAEPTQSGIFYAGKNNPFLHNCILIYILSDCLWL